MKKLKFLLLCVVLLLSTISFGQSGTTGPLTWSLSGSAPNYTLTISGNDTMPNYSSSNSQPWYSYLNSITTVVISNGVTTIGERAFYFCSGLTSVTIPNSITSIEYEAFYNCISLTSVIIPDSVTSIGNYAFNSCYKLQTVNYNAINCTSMGHNVFSFTTFWTLNIGNRVKTIPNNTFSGCRGLTSVTIPDSVTSIGDYAFGLCDSLTSIIIGNSVTSIGDGAFQNCSNLTSVTIPDSVTTIGAYAFSDCSGLTFVTIGNSVTTIGYSAFNGCNGLTSVTIPDSVTSIGVHAFGDCTSLQTVNFNAINCTTMGSSVFYGDTAFRTLNIGNYVKAIPNYIFNGCNGLTSVTIPDSVTSIGNGAFGNCSNLNTITIGEGVTSVVSAFTNCSNLTIINFNAVSCNAGQMFVGTTPTTLNIGEKVQIIPGAAFWSLPLSGNLIIPNSVTTIGYGAFYGGDFSSITIGNSVTSIEHSAFYGCDSLISITSKAMAPPVLVASAFYNVPANIPVYVPCGSLNAYQTDTNWNYFTNFVIDSTTSVADSIFYNAVKCYNVGYTDNNFTTPINSAGTYYIRLVNNTGCDSVMCMTLTENPPILATNYSDTICYGTTYTDNNFTNLTASGQYYDTLQNVNGCDSVVCLTLIVNPVYFTQIKDTICDGEIYILNGKTYTTANIYRDTLQTIHGCDSIFELTLTVNPVYNVPIVAAICEGDSYNFLGKTLTTSGIYYDTLPTVNGCDSIIELTLTVNPVYNVPIVAAICEGDSYNFFSKMLTTSGVYYDTLPTVNGCDSIIELTLIVDSVYFTQIKDSISAGSSYNFHGKQLTAAGIYYDTLQSIHGCDSIFELMLTISNVGIVGANGIRPIQIYPNPAFTKLHVKLETQEVADYKIYSITGQIILQGKTQDNSSINIESLANGMYYLKIAGKTVKFVKE